MSTEMNRRRFLKSSVAASALAALSFEEQALLAQNRPAAGGPAAGQGDGDGQDRQSLDLPA